MRFFSKQGHFQPQFHSKATQLSTHAMFTSNLEVGNDFCLFSCSWKGSVTRGTITFLSLLPCLLEANWWFLRSSQRKHRRFKGSTNSLRASSWYKSQVLHTTGGYALIICLSVGRSLGHPPGAHGNPWGMIQICYLFFPPRGRRVV